MDFSAFQQLMGGFGFKNPLEPQMPVPNTVDVQGIQMPYGAPQPGQLGSPSNPMTLEQVKQVNSIVPLTPEQQPPNPFGFKDNSNMSLLGSILAGGSNPIFKVGQQSYRPPERQTYYEQAKQQAITPPSQASTSLPNPLGLRGGANNILSNILSGGFS